MPWLNIDDQMAFHRKVVRAGNEAVGAWLRMLCWCSAQLTDGAVDRSVAMTIAKRKRVLDCLVDAGLLERRGGDFVIHDYLEWNPTASEVKADREALSAKRAAAGLAGSSKRWRSKNTSSGTGSALPRTPTLETISHPQAPVENLTSRNHSGLDSKPDGKPDGKQVAKNSSNPTQPYPTPPHPHDLNNKAQLDPIALTPNEGRAESGRITLQGFSDRIANAGIQVCLGNSDRERFSRLFPVEAYEIDHAIEATRAAAPSHPLPYLFGVIEGERKRAADVASQPKPPGAGMRSQRQSTYSKEAAIAAINAYEEEKARAGK